MTRFEGDWAAFVEQAQRVDGDDDAWGARLAHAATAFFPGAQTTWVAHLTHQGLAETVETTFVHTSERRYQKAFEIGRGLLEGQDNFVAFFFPPHVATTHTEIERTVTPATRSFIRDFRASFGAGDVLGLLSRPSLGELMMIGAIVDRPLALTPAERVILTRAALHLEAAYRLRKRPESVKAILDSSGRVLERIGEVPELDALPRLSTTSLELWPALVAGRLSLVPRGKGKSRRLLLVENDTSAQPMRALSRVEVDVLRLATRGLSSKLIAYALGTSSTRVSVALSTASAKLGAASRLDLVRLGAILTRDPRGDTLEPKLTSSEREVLGLLQRGLSNEAIAKMRGRSVRTIANQVAALLRKTGTSSRRELASRTD